MITDITVSHYARVTTKDSRGQTVNTYPESVSISCNLQPISLNQATISAWGGQTLSADNRIMFFYPNDTVKKLDRIVDQYGDIYEVRNINRWGSPPFGHYEALLLPVQGE